MNTRLNYVHSLYQVMAERRYLRKTGAPQAAINEATKRAQVLMHWIHSFAPEPSLDVVYLLPNSSRQQKPVDFIGYGLNLYIFNISTTSSPMLKSYPVATLQAVA